MARRNRKKKQPKDFGDKHHQGDIFRVMIDEKEELNTLPCIPADNGMQSEIVNNSVITFDKALELNGEKLYRFEYRSCLVFIPKSMLSHLAHLPRRRRF